jgi:dipeptidyl aminopeptidase/acylaminoacyl peptidase
MYAPPGYLLFLKEQTLMAQPFDPNKFQLSGEPTPIAEQVSYNPGTGRAWFCVSDNGVLVYVTGIFANRRRLTWFDRSGKQLRTVEAPESRMLSPVLSPDEKRLAILRSDSSAGNDIWLIDVSRGSNSRFTFDPANEGNPLWSPDGSRIVFSSNRLGPYDLYWKLSNGAGNEELLFKSDYSKFPTDWSSDGRFLVYQESTEKNQMDLWALPLFGDQKPISIVQTNFNESQARFSPDGRWIAYVSNESGMAQIYVQSFPPSGSKWMISINGGSQPKWRHDGRELFYIAPEGKVMAVQLKSDGNNFEAANPSPLFDTRLLLAGPPTNGGDYAITNDGQRFLINVPIEESSPAPFVVVQNWTAALKNK